MRAFFSILISLLLLVLSLPAEAKKEDCGLRLLTMEEIADAEIYASQFFADIRRTGSQVITPAFRDAVAPFLEKFARKIAKGQKIFVRDNRLIRLASPVIYEDLLSESHLELNRLLGKPEQHYDAERGRLETWVRILVSRVAYRLAKKDRLNAIRFSDLNHAGRSTGRSRGLSESDVLDRRVSASAYDPKPDSSAVDAIHGVVDAFTDPVMQEVARRRFFWRSRLKKIAEELGISFGEVRSKLAVARYLIQIARPPLSNEKARSKEAIGRHFLGNRKLFLDIATTEQKEFIVKHYLQGDLSMGRNQKVYRTFHAHDYLERRGFIPDKNGDWADSFFWNMRYRQSEQSSQAEATVFAQCLQAMKPGERRAMIAFYERQLPLKQVMATYYPRSSVSSMVKRTYDWNRELLNEKKRLEASRLVRVRSAS